MKFWCLPLAGEWLELENIILSEVSQVQKAKDHLYLIVEDRPNKNTTKLYICKNIYKTCIQKWNGRRDQERRKRRKEM
jgi:hypothetical protein